MKTYTVIRKDNTKREVGRIGHVTKKQIKNVLKLTDMEFNKLLKTGQEIKGIYFNLELKEEK